MLLNMELGSIMMRFKIDNYVEFKNRYLDDEEQHEPHWCEISLSLKDRTWLNYDVQGAEMLDSWDIDHIVDTLGKMFDGEITEDQHLSFVEPDLYFDFYPTNCVCRSYEVGMDMMSRVHGVCYGNLSISIWAVDGLTSNSLKLFLSEEKLYIFFLYLQLATNKLSIEDENIKTLIEAGYIILD